jgi:hypothetical protein
MGLTVLGQWWKAVWLLLVVVLSSWMFWWSVLLLLARLWQVQDTEDVWKR